MLYDDDYDNQDYTNDEIEETSNRQALISYHGNAYQQPGHLSDRFLLSLVCLTITMIICTVTGWKLWESLSKMLTSITGAITGLFNGFGQAAPAIGWTLGLALATIPIIGVAWLAGHAYIVLKGHSIRNRTFAVHPEVNNYAALYDERRGIFIQPEAGELPQRVPQVPQTYSPHISYKGETARYSGENDYEIDEEQEQQKLLPPPRFTIEELAHITEYNSMCIPIGRSLTNNGDPVFLDIESSGHMLVLGITQKGKSSLIASHLDIITRTHDRQHVLLAILDLENKTGKLFENAPHLIRVQGRRKVLTLHARDVHQVAEFLELLRDEMDRRYTLSEAQQQCQPFTFIYFEEFLSFRRSNKLATEKRDRAFNDFSEIAKRGLKVRMKLLASAQLNYAAKEEDVKEAMGNFDTYLAFCVKPDAARAAGMVCTELLNANFEAKKPGQFVIESTSCNDLVQSPDFPLKQKLLDHEKSKQVENKEEDSQRFQFQGKENDQKADPETSQKPVRNSSRNESRNEQEDSPEASLHSKVIQVMEIPGETMKDCIIRVWKVKPGDSEDYRAARAEYEQVQKIIHSMARRGMQTMQTAEQEV